MKKHVKTSRPEARKAAAKNWRSTAHVTRPDFGRFFRTRSSAPINFVTRSGANFDHDLVYLRSYIHDAHFRLEDVALADGVLTVHLRRDRWERYRAPGKLDSIASRLTISPVRSLAWEFKCDLARSIHKLPETEFDITDLHLVRNGGNGSRDRAIVLSNPSTAYRLWVDLDGDPTIRLQDEP